MRQSIAHTAPLAGLTIEEAIEFEMLDALPPFDDRGRIGWIFEGEPTSHREKRWLELYTKLTARSRRGATPTQMKRPAAPGQKPSCNN
jgi:hypothetical protein